MSRVFEESFKIMAVELSCAKGSVSAAALELGIDAGRISKWRTDPRFNGGNLLPKNDKLTPEEQEWKCNLKVEIFFCGLALCCTELRWSYLQATESYIYLLKRAIKIVCVQRAGLDEQRKLSTV